MAYHLHSSAFFLLFIISLSLQGAIADLVFTSPSGSSYSGGTTLEVSWRDDDPAGPPPHVSDYERYTLELCTGSNDEIVPLHTLVENARMSGAGVEQGEVQVVVPKGVGESTGGEVYFLRMTLTIAATSKLQGTTIHFSSRFGLTDMTGTFSPATKRLNSLSDGSPPPSPIKNLLDTPTATTGMHDVPYNMQTGTIRYAPMQKQPGTKITAKGAKRQFPTSKLPEGGFFKRGEVDPPTVQTTVTQPWDYVVTSLENTASPAPMPDEEWEKYMNRWKD